MASDDQKLLVDQIRYYRARAAEYDATSTPEGNPFAQHGDATRSALRAFEPRGRVLERRPGRASGPASWPSTPTSSP